MNMRVIASGGLLLALGCTFDSDEADGGFGLPDGEAGHSYGAYGSGGASQAGDGSGGFSVAGAAGVPEGGVGGVSVGGSAGEPTPGGGYSSGGVSVGGSVGTPGGGASGGFEGPAGAPGGGVGGGGPGPDCSGEVAACFLELSECFRTSEDCADLLNRCNALQQACERGAFECLSFVVPVDGSVDPETAGTIAERVCAERGAALTEIELLDLGVGVTCCFTGAAP